MMDSLESAVTPHQIRSMSRDLRRRFGDHDWLTVVGGVTAEAYRAAGLGAEEFSELLRSETARRGMLKFHIRRKPLMRLRKGFDGQSGGITLEDGFAHLHLHCEAGYYTDSTALAELSVSFAVRSSLLVTGGLNRPLGLLGLRGLPGCLARGGGRVHGVTQDHFTWGSVTRVTTVSRYETLARMPEDVACELALEEQEDLGHIPWLDYRAEPVVGVRSTIVATAATAPRPALRLV